MYGLFYNELNNEYSNEYLSYTRELEFAFSGICEEFQA